MFTSLNHTIVPIDIFLADYMPKYRRATKKIDCNYLNKDINYLEEFKDSPSSIWKKFLEPDCYVSMVFDSLDEIMAFSITYGYDNETCILGARSFVVIDCGYETVGLLSAFCIPSQMLIQRAKYKFGMTTFNLNNYTDRLWKAHCRTFSKNWNKHQKTVNAIFPGYDYPRTYPQPSPKIINFVKQRYSLVEL